MMSLSFRNSPKSQAHLKTLQTRYTVIAIAVMEHPQQQ